MMTEKMRKKLAFCLLFVALILASIAFVQADIQTCKTEYKTTETVSIKSNYISCYNLDEGSKVKVYIVKDKTALTLNIVKEQEILNSKFSCTEIWKDPSVGEYDVFVDCTGNKNYDALEPSASFVVLPVTGTASASRGERDIGSHIWRYDSEEPNLVNEMLQLSLDARGEDIELENITIRASGSGDDTKIDKLEIYVDENNNGRVDSDDELIGDSQPACLVNDGITTVPLDFVLEKDKTTMLLVVYVMRETTSEGNFSLDVQSISGIGSSSKKIIVFSGLPIASGVKSVLSEKTCLGKLVLELNPNPAARGRSVIAKISGLTGCENKTIVLRPNPCGSSLEEKINSCIIEAEKNGCEITFVSSKSQTIHACIDKNQDGDMIDFGEYNFKDLVVEEAKITEKEKITEGVNITEGNVTEKEPTITGGIIEEIKEKLSGTSNLFFLLEVTLLLILLVLVLILFRLRRPAAVEKKREE